MEIGIVGLGRMGANMARRLARGGARVQAYDRASGAREALSGEANVACVESPAALCAQLGGERVLLLSLPAGAATAQALAELRPLLSAGDTVVDGGNAYYKDSMRHALELSQAGLRFVDAGISGGIHGLAEGYCLMLGGTPASVERFAPFARLLAPGEARGWLHCGPAGAGHYAKMIHNGIEYGMMQALAEGFALLAARRDLGIEPAQLAETWRHGSVIRSWLLDLCAEALQDEEALARIAPVVEDSGEGRWTALESVELGVPAPVITAALMERFASRGRADDARRLLALLRAGFGGHAVKRA
ncbi:MAG TPA: decarboxylating 6-phosphogluconate dehydrogenase [Burkholderiales bacterium]|nr:decarboxylating 6-phosphogluconate dehydrogenase [Burkholderiales bacterium]